MTNVFAIEAIIPPANAFELGLVPLPVSVVRRQGAFAITHRTRIIADTVARSEAEYLSCFLTEVAGLPVETLSASSETAGAIVLRLRPDATNGSREGYRLSVDDVRVVIEADAPAGLFYGVQTLLQLLPADIYSESVMRTEVAIPAVTVEDAPRFAWRGAMLDVARWHMPVDFILRFIDLISYHKLNVLHLHLNDDQGWRLEIRKYPKLTSVGAYRAETMIGHTVQHPADDHFDPTLDRFDEVPHGGFYTQQEMREIVRYAAARHVNVVPEIDMPGHAQAAIAAYPEFGCSIEVPQVSTRWGVHPYLFNPFEHTIRFLQDVLAEVVEVFPSEYIHVGGDEAVKKQWLASVECQFYMRGLGLTTGEELQSYIISRMEDFLAERSRRLVGWDEILEGPLPPNAVVMSWRGEQGGVEAAMAGHDVIMTPCQFTYFDFYQSQDRDTEPAGAPHGFTPLSTVYGYDPVPHGLPVECAHHVLGSQGQLWTEYMPTPRLVEYMAFPRLCALAEVVWGDSKGRDYAEFLDRLHMHTKRLDAMEVNYRPLEPTACDL